MRRRRRTIPVVLHRLEMLVAFAMGFACREFIEMAGWAQ